MTAIFKSLAFTKTGRLIAACLVLASVLAGVLASVYALGGSHARLKDTFKDLETIVSIEGDRKQDDAYLQNLSDTDLCIEYFRGANRVRDETECRALRGLYKQ